PLFAYFFGGVRFGTIIAVTTLVMTALLVHLELHGVYIAPKVAEADLSSAHVLLGLMSLIYTPEVAFIYSFLTEKVKEERETELAEVDRLGRSDTLTGLDNRIQFDNTLIDHLGRDQRFSLCCIDLDGFKPINDQYGHDVGDEVLQTVAQRLREY